MTGKMLRLTRRQVAKILEKPWERGSGIELAREFGVVPALISQIRNGMKYKAWNEPPPREVESEFRARGMVHCADGRFWARLSLGPYDTHLEATRANARAIEKLGGAEDNRE